jgi:predicted nucleic acid-binding Zn ribbon protein
MMVKPFFISIFETLSLYLLSKHSEMDKLCLDCGEPIHGRSDKKFCSDQCRNNYNNTINRDANNYVRNINNILRKNRRILADLNPQGKITVTREKLASKGFNFKFHTNTYITKNGHTYYFCYEHGYLPLDNNLYALVVREKPHF